MKGTMSYKETWIHPGLDSKVYVVAREFDDGHWAYNLARKNGKDVCWCYKRFIGATEEKISEVIDRQRQMDELIADGVSVLEVLEAIFG